MLTKKRFKLVAAIVLVFTAFFSQAAVAYAAPKVLVFNHGKEIKAWDPSIDDSGGSFVIGNIFEGLMKDTKDGKLAPGQAEKYTISPDGLTYTFYLKPNITWSDGKPVTAKDFEYAWLRLLDPKAGSEYSYMGTSYIKNAKAFFDGKAKASEVGVKALDDKTFQVVLESKVPYFLNLTTFFSFMPVRKDIVEKYGDGWEKNPKTCISNGPFVLESYKIGDNLTIAKNPKYYDSKNVKIDKVKMVFVSDQTTALNAFNAGDIHVNPEIPPAEIPRLIAEEPNLVFTPRKQTAYIIFNVDKPPFNDVRVRKAFALALNRKAICESALKGGETPATGIVPPVLSLSTGESFRTLGKNGKPTTEYGIDPNSARVEEAQKLLAEAGYPNGKGFPKVTYTYVTRESLKKMSEAIQEMLKNNLNVKVELDNMEWQVLVDKRKRGDFIISGGNWTGDYADPMTFFDAYATDSSWNECQWRWKKSKVAPNDTVLNPEHKAFEQEILMAQKTSGTTRDGHLKNAEKILMDATPVSPLYYGNFCYLVNQDKVRDVWMNKVGEYKFWDAEMVQ